MDYKRFTGRKGPEDWLSIDVAVMLRVATLEGRMRGTWTHVANEVVGRDKTAPIRMAKARAMGLVKGSCDFVFVWPDGGGWIELKTKDGSLTPAQQDFRDWCEMAGSRHAVCRTVEEVTQTLFEWGVLTPR